MAHILQYTDVNPSMTPPLSDRGDCEEQTIPQPEHYLTQGFYPSPAPSFSYQQASVIPQSPDLCQSDSTYDTEDDGQQMFYLGPANCQLYTTTSLSETTMFPTTTSYQSYEQGSWMPYTAYQSDLPPITYADTEPVDAFSSYAVSVPNSLMPPVPEGITTGGSFSFNDPVTKTQSHRSMLGALELRHDSSSSVGTTSTSGLSSRSSSPEQTHSTTNTRHKRRESVMSTKSTGSSLHTYGVPVMTGDGSNTQAWRCAFPNCTSRAVFTRGCDLRKHYNRHSKHLFCRVASCPQSEVACIAAAHKQALQTGASPLDLANLAISGGFSSKKDRARHEAKHNPGIKCDWTGPGGEECGRLFSRMDNMKDHVRRIHNKGQSSSSQDSKSTKSKTAMFS